MVDKAGKVTIGDFGLAKEICAGLMEHSSVGTPHWRELLLRCSDYSDNITKHPFGCHSCARGH